MQASASGECQVRQCSVVGERVAGRVAGVVEQQEEAVGAIDLSATVANEQVARATIVLDPPSAVRASPIRSASSVLSTTSVKSRARLVMRAPQARA